MEPWVGNDIRWSLLLFSHIELSGKMWWGRVNHHGGSKLFRYTLEVLIALLLAPHFVMLVSGRASQSKTGIT